MRRNLLGFIFHVACVASVFAQEKTLTDAELGAKGKAATALVEIGNGQAFGTAFCVDSRGYFVTNCHVVKSNSQSVKLILLPGEATQRSVTAQVVRVDDKLDLALIKLSGDKPFETIELGNEDGLSELQEVIAFGYPFGTGLAVNTGEYPSISINLGRITALRKNLGKLTRIQIDAILNPGNSGGPILDKKGCAIGVAVSGIVGAGAVNFAIPISHLRQFLDRPTLAFVPPALTKTNLHDSVEFRATAASTLKGASDLEVELILGSSPADERHFDMKPSKGGYAALAVPFPVSNKIPNYDVTIKFADGTVTGKCEDVAFRVGESVVNLSDSSVIRISAKGETVLKKGITLKGAITRLDILNVKINGQTIPFKLSGGVEIKVAPVQEPANLQCKVIVKQGSKELCREETILHVQGSTVWAQPETEVVAAGPEGNGNSASLEALVEENFTKPEASEQPTTYLNTISTAGDYIGQGKRYSYSAKELDVKAADGLINVTTHGKERWDIHFAPPKGKLFKPGEYPQAKRYPFNDGSPGISISGEGRGCNEILGKFVVWEFVVEGAQVKRIAIDFVQHCEQHGPPLAGSFRYHSSFK